MHCDVVIAAVKLPLLCADAVDHPNNPIVMIARIGTATRRYMVFRFHITFSFGMMLAAARAGRIFVHPNSFVICTK
jgi:hypothetical protein